MPLGCELITSPRFTQHQDKGEVRRHRAIRDYVSRGRGGTIARTTHRTGGRPRSSPPGKLPPHVQQAWPVPLVASDDMHGVAIGCPPEIDPQVPRRPWGNLLAALKATPRQAEVEEPHGNLSNEESSHLTTTSSGDTVSGLSTARPGAEQEPGGNDVEYVPSNVFPVAV